MLGGRWLWGGFKFGFKFGFNVGLCPPPIGEIRTSLCIFQKRVKCHTRWNHIVFIKAKRYGNLNHFHTPNFCRHFTIKLRKKIKRIDLDCVESTSGKIDFSSDSAEL